ncbi:ceramidase domain-containing protein [Salinarimonas soli]|uniref:Ceramidase n=1 Tax=Salinarimonas soli TaxID=1638099 RepID=A0A5B2V9V8_9HYPH|nr:ceramidase domain-containing protein [Salinarimonas soli]KAA2235508.1 ceramidase [Salinarimonas soli]
MSWFAPIDLYCERTSAGFWAEPVNAFSNAAFLIAASAAYLLWRRGGGRDGPALALICIVAVVGIGSFLFHTFANRWSLLADVLPITVFIYGYFVLAMRRFVGLGVPAALAITGAFLAFNVPFETLWRLALGPGAPTLNGSVGYLPPAAALVAVGAFLSWRAPRATFPGLDRLAARSLFGAAAVFALSLTFRTLDHAACATIPIGTHFAWHGLNGLVLYLLVRGAIRHGTLRAPPLSHGERGRG